MARQVMSWLITEILSKNLKELSIRNTRKMRKIGAQMVIYPGNKGVKVRVRVRFRLGLGFGAITRLRLRRFVKDAKSIQSHEYCWVFQVPQERPLCQQIPWCKGQGYFKRQTKINKQSGKSGFGIRTLVAAILALSYDTGSRCTIWLGRSWISRLLGPCVRRHGCQLKHHQYKVLWGVGS